MALKPAKKKHFNVPFNNPDFLPHVGNKITCYFSGNCCIVKDIKCMADLYKMVSSPVLGRGRLSKKCKMCYFKHE